MQARRLKAFACRSQWDISGSYGWGIIAKHVLYKSALKGIGIWLGDESPANERPALSLSYDFTTV